MEIPTEREVGLRDDLFDVRSTETYMRIQSLQNSFIKLYSPSISSERRYLILDHFWKNDLFRKFKRDRWFSSRNEVFNFIILENEKLSYCMQGICQFHNFFKT
jgi:hypothetical protein